MKNRLKTTFCYKAFAVGSLIFLLDCGSVLFAEPAVSRLKPSRSSLPSSEHLTTISWYPSSGPEVLGYAVYHRVAGIPFTNRVDVGDALKITMPLLVGALHSIFVVAYTVDMVESKPSGILIYIPSPLTQPILTKLKDGSMQIRFRTSPFALCRVEWTPTLNPPVWQMLGAGVVQADLSGDVVLCDPDAIKSVARFYRARKLWTVAGFKFSLGDQAWFGDAPD